MMTLPFVVRLVAVERLCCGVDLGGIVGCRHSTNLCAAVSLCLSQCVIDVSMYTHTPLDQAPQQHLGIGHAGPNQSDVGLAAQRQQPVPTKGMKRQTWEYEAW